MSSGAGDDQRVTVLLDQRADDRLDVLDQLPTSNVSRYEVHPAGLDLGEIQDVVDQAEQMLAGPVDLLEIRQEGLVV